MLDWAKNKFQEGQDLLKKEVSRYKNKDFMNGCVAIGVYIAFADGVVSPQEKQKLIKYFEVSDALNVFKMEEVIGAFEKISSKFDFDLEIGKLEALKIIAKLKDKSDQARAAVRLGVIVAKSDGNFDECEQKAMIEICQELNIEPKEFF